MTFAKKCPGSDEHTKNNERTSMSRLMSFCINTCRNERNYIELLFRSLRQNLSRKDHEIIVYVENDNQGTVEFLRTQREPFPNLKIIVNPLPVPLDYARNINLMFEMSTHEIVSYIQSDMVICKNYDLEVLKHVTPDTIISSTRIEPPLHPLSPEKITYDFGLDPKVFDLDTFSAFAETCKKNETIHFWFAPFTMYKNPWVDIGGHDTLMRRSRVDSDVLYRLSLNGIKTLQAWNAIVYHFTCTSSRGPKWWTETGKARAQLQQIADNIELMRFIRKWGEFKHPSTPDDVKNDYVYRISANITGVAPNDVGVLSNYYLFHRIYIDNITTRNMTELAWNQMHLPANKLHEISDADWNKYKKYYRLWEFGDIFPEAPITDDDVIININLKGQPFSEFLKRHGLYIPKLGQEYIHNMNPNDVPTEYEVGDSGEKLIVNRVVNRIKENLVVTNPSIDDVPLIIA